MDVCGYGGADYHRRLTDDCSPGSSGAGAAVHRELGCGDYSRAADMPPLFTPRVEQGAAGCVCPAGYADVRRCHYKHSGLV